MRVFLLYKFNIKPGSYADYIRHAWLSFFSEQQYSISETGSFSKARKLALNTHNTVISMDASMQSVDFIQSLRLRSLIKKQRIKWTVQFTKSHFLSLPRIPQLIVPHDLLQLPAKFKLSPASYLAVSSEAEKEMAVQKWNLADDHVLVIQASAGNIYSPMPWTDKQSVKMKHMQGREYFLITAKGKTQASFLSFLKAFSGFKKWQHSSMKLAVSGSLTFAQTDDWKEKINSYRYREDVIVLKEEEEPLSTLLAGAYAFIHTPSQDNDVIPLLQSMQCQTPCISFATAPIKEYAGDAAVVIDNLNYEELSDKMILLYKDEIMRSRLIENGTQRMNVFTPENTRLSLQQIMQQSIGT